MACEAEQRAFDKASRINTEWHDKRLGWERKAAEAKSARLDGILEGAEGLFSPNPAKVARGGKHAGEAKARLEEAEREAEKARDKEISTGKDLLRALQALEKCKKKKTPRPRPPAPDADGGWKGSVTFVYEEHSHGNWQQMAMHGHTDLEYTETHTWEIVAGSRDADAVRENRFPAKWTVRTEGEFHDSHTSPAGPGKEDWWIAPGANAVASSSLTIAADGSSLEIKGPVLLKTASGAKKYHWEAVEPHMPPDPVGDAAVDVKEEPVDIQRPLGSSDASHLKGDFSHATTPRYAAAEDPDWYRAGAPDAKITWKWDLRRE